MLYYDTPCCRYSFISILRTTIMRPNCILDWIWISMLFPIKMMNIITDVHFNSMLFSKSNLNSEFLLRNLIDFFCIMESLNNSRGSILPFLNCIININYISFRISKISPQILHSFLNLIE